MATAATAVGLFQPNEDKRRWKHQQASSYDTGKEPHEAAEVVVGSEPCFPIGKVKQDVSYNAEEGEPQQRVADASGTFSVAHGGAGSWEVVSFCFSSVMP